MCPLLLLAARLASIPKIAPTYRLVSCSCSPFLSLTSHPGAWTSLLPYLALPWDIALFLLASTIYPSLCNSFRCTIGASALSVGVVAAMFFTHIVQQFGLQGEVVHDQDVRFTADLWWNLWALLGTRVHLSSTHHPQSDG